MRHSLTQFAWQSYKRDVWANAQEEWPRDGGRGQGDAFLSQKLTLPGTDSPSQGDPVSKTSRMGPSNSMDTGGLKCMQLVSIQSTVGASLSHGFYPLSSPK